MRKNRLNAYLIRWALLLAFFNMLCTGCAGGKSPGLSPSPNSPGSQTDLLLAGHDLSTLDANSLTDSLPRGNKTDGASKITPDGTSGKRDVGLRDAGVTIPGTWVTVPPSNASMTFNMGSPSNDVCRESDETQHQVTLTNHFEIQTTEVTQAQFNSLMGYNPSRFTSCGNNCPVESLDWSEAAAYCNALSAIKGLTKCYTCSGSSSSVNCNQNSSYGGVNIYSCPGYRLPTEAEWEYAYRAGSSTSFYNNMPLTNCNSSDSNANAISWNGYNSSNSTHPVGMKVANSWGLYDMAGNVYEWCNDYWDQSNYSSSAVTNPWGLSSASYRVKRGGAYYHTTTFALRAANRSENSPSVAEDYLGFRCVRTK